MFTVGVVLIPTRWATRAAETGDDRHVVMLRRQTRLNGHVLSPTILRLMEIDVRTITDDEVTAWSAGESR